MACKTTDKQKVHAKAYYKANREKIITCSKMRYKNNKEEIKGKRDKEKRKISDKRYREKHKERNKVLGKTWYINNKERIKAYCKANREKRYARTRAWRKNNPGYNRIYLHNYRAQQKVTQIEHIKAKVVFIRDRGICQICHKKVNNKLKYPNFMRTSLDHIIPLSQGGTHTYANIQLAHLRCNLSKRADILPQGEQMRLF